MTLGALDGQAIPPSRAWPQVNKGMGGKSNLARLRGFEPPTFGPGVESAPRLPVQKGCDIVMRESASREEQDPGGR